MKELYSNINIIGGGLIGVSSAFFLSNLGYKITIIEKNPIYNIKKNNSDNRTIAISEGTKHFLEEHGIWSEIKKYAEPIKSIKVIDRKINNYLDFDNKRRNSNLGYIVKNKQVLDIFYKKVLENKNINIFNNASIKKIEHENDSIKSFANNFKITSDINIIADGKNGSTINLLKTPQYKKKYNKKALVLILTHEKNHENTAYEFFYKNGPLAVLPMQKRNGKFQSSIVWTNEVDYLDALSKSTNKQIISFIEKHTHYFLGRVDKIISKKLFIISAHLNNRFYEKRTIYLGDSAHSIHPIAGQGWNLGMRDVKKLIEIAKKYKAMGIEPGDSIFCKEYQNASYYDAYSLYQITDKLDNLFRSNNKIVYLGRYLGLKLINNNKYLKDKISDFAMGFN